MVPTYFAKLAVGRGLDTHGLYKRRVLDDSEPLQVMQTAVQDVTASFRVTFNLLVVIQPQDASLVSL